MSGKPFPSNRVSSDAPLDSSKYSSPRDLTATKWDFTTAAAWATATPYIVGDLVKNGVLPGKGYRCIDAHTSAAATEPGEGATWTDVWEDLGDNVILLSALHANLATMDISWIARVLLFVGGKSPATAFTPTEDRMEWDLTNLLLTIPDDIGTTDVIRVEVDGPSRVEINVGQLDVEVEAVPGAGQKADAIILGLTTDGTLPQAGNLAPPVKALAGDANGRAEVVGPAGEVSPMVGKPVMIAGRYDDSAVEATLTTAFATPNSDLTWTAVAPGVEGDSITVEYKVGTNAIPTIGVTGTAILITGKITTTGVTANQVKALVAASPLARSLASCEDAPGNDGSGNIEVMAATPLTAGAGVARVKGIRTSILGYIIEASADAIKTAVQTVASAVIAIAATIVKVMAIGINDGTGKAIAPLGDATGRLRVIVEGGYTMGTEPMDCTAAEIPGDCVYNLAGTARKTNFGVFAKTPGMGTILSKSDATHCIVVYGGENPSNSGLVPGAAYYGDIVDGLLTATVPTAAGGFNRTQVMGRANAAGVLIVHPEQDYPAP